MNKASDRQRGVARDEDGTCVDLQPVPGNALGDSSLLKNLGYQVFVHLMDVPPDEAFRRMVLRYLNTGRLINPGYVAGIGSKPKSTYIALRERRLADGYAIHDNSVAKSSSPVVSDESGEAVGALYGSRGSGHSGGRSDAASPRGRKGGEGTSQGSEGRLTDAASAAHSIDPDQFIPVGVVSRDGQLAVETRSARELLDEIDADRQFADDLGLCLKIKGGAA